MDLDLSKRRPETQRAARRFMRLAVDQPTMDMLDAVRVEYEDLAGWLIELIPDNPELTVALRRLGESMDCANRALIETLAEVQPGAKVSHDGGRWSITQSDDEEVSAPQSGQERS